MPIRPYRDPDKHPYTPSHEDRIIQKIDDERQDKLNRSEIRGEAERKKLTVKARGWLVELLRRKLSAMKHIDSNSRYLEINHDSLVATLGLDNVYPPLSETELDAIAVMPGLEKIPVGYKITSPETFLEQINQPSVEAQILTLLQANQQDEYSVREMSLKLNQDEYTIRKILKRLLTTRKIAYRLMQLPSKQIWIRKYRVAETQSKDKK